MPLAFPFPPMDSTLDLDLVNSPYVSSRQDLLYHMQDVPYQLLQSTYLSEARYKRIPSNQSRLNTVLGVSQSPTVISSASARSSLPSDSSATIMCTPNNFLTVTPIMDFTWSSSHSTLLSFMETGNLEIRTSGFY
ncbi:hypothetical protein F5877DRAFT_76097 [Lentinula edodes]|nr:hypothetical protein F5877DRAFT_76097 [Lentinula edodes]